MYIHNKYTHIYYCVYIIMYYIYINVYTLYTYIKLCIHNSIYEHNYTHIHTITIRYLMVANSKQQKFILKNYNVSLFPDFL